MGRFRGYLNFIILTVRRALESFDLCIEYRQMVAFELFLYFESKFAIY